MTGLDNKWYQIGEGNKVSFRELPYGKYTFEVRNTKGDGQKTLSSLKIEILPPLWLRWWAKIIYLLLIAIVVAYGIKRYKDRLRRQADEALNREKESHQKEIQEERMAFFTNITHELRTPLTLISGPLDDMMKSDTLNQNDRWKIGLIHKNTQRLLQLVNQILDFRKTETSNKRLCVDKDDIVKTVKETTLKFVELNRNRDVNMTVDAQVESLYMWYDKDVIVMILDNLISNAMKYTESGEIIVGIKKTVRDNRQWIDIYVKDTGHGIGDEALPHIFDRYYQEKSEYQASGTGIGLALVKSLVTLHHGEISADSKLNEGSCFEVMLACDEEYPEAIHIEASSSDEGMDAVQNKENDDVEYNDIIRVLVVEDNSDILDYVEKSLSGIFDVKIASNGKEGLEMARKYMPDVIVTDIMMPVMNGIEMCKHLKRDVATSHIPVVILTAKDSMGDREEGYKAGADSYLTKPFNASLLVARVNNIIARRAMLAEHIRNNEPVGNIKTKANDNHCANQKEEEQNRLAESLSKIDKEFMEKLDGIILDPENAGMVNIDFLTDRLFMSRPTLYRKMKALTGMSANEYIRQVRMAKAKDYILEGKMTMGEISDTLGFSSQSYFRETFKTVFGVTPTAYVSSLKKEQKGQ